MDICVRVPGCLEGNSAVLCPCSRLQCKRSWSPAGCAAGAGTFSGFQETADVESWILQLMAMNNKPLTTLFCVCSRLQVAEPPALGEVEIEPRNCSLLHLSI